MSSLELRDHYDVIVAGARAAGAPTAMLLGRRGLRVLMVDPVPRGRDTLSTHALMRSGVLQLRRWGLLDRIIAAGTPAARVTTFDYGDETIAVPIKDKDGVDALFAPRRTVLDPILVGAAEEAGVHVAFGLAVRGLVRDADGRVTGAWLDGVDPRFSRAVSADLVIGADGVRSRVARLVQAPMERRGSHSTASIYGYWHGLSRPGHRWYFRPGVGIGTIPTNHGDTCVFVSMTPQELHAGRAEGLEGLFHRTVRRVDPTLAEELEYAHPSGDLRGFAGVRSFFRRSVGPGWALVGDAGYFRDPLTAHGISDAFRDAELLARAVSGGSDEALEGYQTARDAAARGLMDVTDRIASLTWTMDEVKALHKELSREMNVALAVVEGFGVTDGPFPSGSVGGGAIVPAQGATVVA
jgi:2-polyprenyl-6-methoxyphenol hydroxylase-like FAD-dependent oxidoreductase